MKIGITCYPTYGGSGAVATELGIQLAERGHEVHFVSYAQPFRLGRFRDRIFFHEVEIEPYPLFEHPPYSLALSVALHETAQKEGLDLLHVHYAIPHATSAWIAREMLMEERSIPIVTTLHGTDITLVGLHPSFHTITRFSILQSQGLTAVSEYLRDETVRDFGVPSDRIEVIPNFIDPELYRQIDGDTVSVPKKMTNPKGPLYRRLRSGEDYSEYVHRQEEPFNHIFDLTFGVLPGDIVGDILNVFTSAGHGHSYESIGRELRTRHYWGEHDNIAQPDGFFVADKSILAIELKFKAKTSLDQLAKYILLFVAEQQIFDKWNSSLDLLYVFNTDPDASFEKQTGVNTQAVTEHMFEGLLASVRNKTAKQFLRDNESDVKDTLRRINVSCISWQDFSDALSAFSEKLKDGAGDRTLKRLISGLTTEIAEHPLSNVD